MTTAAEALVWLIKSDTALATASGPYPNVAPEGATLPSLAYQLIDEQPVMSHGGFGNLQTARWQMTVQAANYLQVRMLARALKKRLNGYTGTVLGIKISYCAVEADQDGYSDPAMLPFAQLDVLMTHDEH